jgi:hypothetical protein
MVVNWLLLIKHRTTTLFGISSLMQPQQSCKKNRDVKKTGWDVAELPSTTVLPLEEQYGSVLLPRSLGANMPDGGGEREQKGGDEGRAAGSW